MSDTKVGQVLATEAASLVPGGVLGVECLACNLNVVDALLRLACNLGVGAGTTAAARRRRVVGNGGCERSRSGASTAWTTTRR